MLTRTNSESIVGAGRLEVRPDLDLTHGVAITSSIHPTADTHVEPVRYGKGSNAMGLLQTLMTDGAGPEGTDVPRWRQLLDQAGEDPKKMLRMLNPKQWSERTMIALVMQHLDNSITTYTKRDKLGVRRMTSKQGHGEPNPTWIPAGNEVTRRIAEKIDGVAGGTWGELFNIPLTAHFLGGAAIGDSPEHGVIDPYQRVYGYPTMSVMDGAAVSANLGVNPSLSITAQAERAAALWPNKGEDDQRPAQGEPYRRLAPIAPKQPVVPVDAPARCGASARPDRAAELGGLDPAHMWVLRAYAGRDKADPAGGMGHANGIPAGLSGSAPSRANVRAGRGRDGARDAALLGADLSVAEQVIADHEHIAAMSGAPRQCASNCSHCSNRWPAT